MSALSGIQIAPPSEIPPSLKLDGPAPAGRGFADQLRAALGPVVESQSAANDELARVLSGESNDLHNLQIATEKAALMTQFTLQVRNKLIDAYREIMQMNV